MPTQNKSGEKLFTLSLAKAVGTHSRLTVMPAGNIADTTATSLIDSRVVNSMSEFQFQTEKKYQVALAIATSLLKKGLLTQAEYNLIDSKLLEKFRPSLGTLLSENALT